MLISAETSRLPFDIAPLQAMPYSLGANGRPNKVKADRAALVRRLEHCQGHDSPDSPLFRLLDGFVAPQVAHEKTDLFQSRIDESEAFRRDLKAAQAKGDEGFQAVQRGLGDIKASEASRVVDRVTPATGRKPARIWERAYDAYRKGFEADWRDAFPGVNATTLAEMLAPGGEAVRSLAPVVRYAAERKIARGAADFWDNATLLEIAVLERDEARIAAVWGHVLADKNTLIAQARENSGEDVSALRALIARLSAS